MLGSAIKSKLARGWRKEDILQILTAPSMVDVRRPFRLAIWRLSRHLSGPGPQLIPLQRKWDREQEEMDRGRWQETLAADYRRVMEITTSDEREALMASTRVSSSAAVDARCVVVAAAHRARRCHPQLTPRSAIQAWLADNTRAPGMDPAAADPPGDEWMSSPDSHTCVACGERSGVIRNELPLRSIVCGACWRQHAVDHPRLKRCS
jgi:hypothetical protein